MNAPQPDIRQGRKFEQVLEGARAVFMRDGFEGANVDEIARQAGVSKATLYSYFADKRLLFMEVAARECRRQAEHAVAMIDMSGPPRQVLRSAAETMMRFFLSDFGRQVFRICVAEADRFPDLGRQFYASGPELVRGVMISYLKGAIDRGELAIDDVELAADQFPELCKASLHIRLLCGIQTEFSDAEIDRVLDGALETFMARYGTEG